jgi:acyl-CoA reductase-like NAD-dependent aldehyde dehydrogenase
MEIINPATGDQIGSIQPDNAESLQQKYKQLQAGQVKWLQIPVSERIAIITRYAGLLEANIEELALTLTNEVGKPLNQSRNEINGSRNRIKWLTSNAEKYLSDETMYADESITEIIRYEPLGVICNISAWNYPYLVGTNVFIPALLAGNAVCYKPSEYATLTGQHIERLLKQAGVPDDVFQVATGGTTVGELLLDMNFNGYFFTGSYKTGKYIYEKVASKMVPCQCELGGKDPLYVTDDITDIQSVAAGTADGAFYNNGQSCCAVERIYVHEGVYDQYITAFVEEVQSWKIGDPLLEGVYIGPLSRKSQISFLNDQVEDALSKGATLMCGGYAPSTEGYFFMPTVLTAVTHEMKVMREESFGPVIGIMKVQSDDEAISLMNDTAYGLTASVYTTDQERAEKILARMHSGTAYWNCCDRVSPSLPWSGRNNSGFGSTLSHAGIRAFTQPKAYHLRK